MITENTINSIVRIGKKALRAKGYCDNLESAKKRVYELSRLLPEEEGYELIEEFNKAIKNTQTITKIIHEKD